MYIYIYIYIVFGRKNIDMRFFYLIEKMIERIDYIIYTNLLF